MRQISFSQAEFAGNKKVTRRERFLAEMERVVPCAALLEALSPHYYPNASPNKRGSPPIGLERMLRMYFLQQWYALADEALEDALYDSQALRNFVGLDLSRESVPDATTPLKFRRLLEQAGLTKRIFETINATLAARGMMMREGAAANEVDVTQAEHLLHGEETVVFADASYVGVEKREALKDKSITWHVAEKRGRIKALPEGELKEPMVTRERIKAQVRSEVEHPFQVVKNLFRYRKVRYNGLAKNTAQLFTLFGLANLVFAKRQLLGAHA